MEDGIIKFTREDIIEKMVEYMLGAYDFESLKESYATVLKMGYNDSLMDKTNNELIDKYEDIFGDELVDDDGKRIVVEITD